MRKTIKKLKKIDLEIQQKKSEINSIDTLVYYQNFSTEEKRKQDKIEMQIELKSLLSIRYGILETLQREIHFEKGKISASERDLTLTINQ